MIKKLATIAVAASALAAAPAIAESPHDTVVQTKVSYTDLDLSSAADRATLDGRIKSAARFVCGSVKGPTLAEHNHNQGCRIGAIASANAQLEQAVARRAGGAVLAARR